MSRLPERVRGFVAGTALALGLATGIPVAWAQAQVSPGPDAPAAKGRYGLGRTPSPQEVAAWDIDVRPDGHGVKPGRGTVASGQAIYDAKCAACHGTFGESNTYMVIAGGVRPEDLKTGRAAGLRDPDVVRTLGNKLASVTTLWDYINRAMPWTAPQSLTVDEVYAVTAYVLHLNEIVPADFELNDRNLITLPMPNRNGFTRAHGMGRVDGKPDVQGSSCLRNCRTEVAITSELPAYAMNAHGDLRRQVRPVGAFGAVDTTRYDVARGAARATVAAVGEDRSGGESHAARDILARRACVACHGLEKRIVGPGFREVASRYQTRDDAQRYLAEKIRKGSVGAWGQVPMPGQPAIKDEELASVIRWIVGGAQ
jgi:cytochrome c